MQFLIVVFLGFATIFPKAWAMENLPDIDEKGNKVGFRKDYSPLKNTTLDDPDQQRKDAAAYAAILI